MFEVTLFVEPCDILSAAIQDLGLYKGFLVQFARALNAFCKCFHQLVDYVTRVVVENFLALLQLFRVERWEIERVLLWLSVLV